MELHFPSFGVQIQTPLNKGSAGHLWTRLDSLDRLIQAGRQSGQAKKLIQVEESELGLD